MERFLSRDIKYLPNNFYNIKADLKDGLMPPLHPGTKEIVSPDLLKMFFPGGLVAHEITTEKYVKIPEKVKAKYAVYRPTPLICATELKKYLDTPADIYFKYEGVSPTGSHKLNTALMQAYIASEEGIKTLATETGAGQWGASLSYAAAAYDIDVRVFMVRTSFLSKPGRKIMMEMHGANVFQSPSNTTKSGLEHFNIDANHPGSLGIAISEAIESIMTDKNAKYALGSVLDSVLLHQTVIGEEALNQLNDCNIYPDVVVGCVGGGSNFGGIAFPFLKQKLNQNKDIRFIAVEPESCPTLTKGELKYDFGDTSGLTPLLYMYSLGKDFIPPSIHAGGLRYHGMSPLVSHLYSKNLIEASAQSQENVFKAARLFFETEGILPAPESSHAIATVIDEALKAKRDKKKKTILFNLSGHGFFDINAYEKN